MQTTFEVYLNLNRQGQKDTVAKATFMQAVVDDMLGGSTAYINLLIQHAELQKWALSAWAAQVFCVFMRVETGEYITCSYSKYSTMNT